MKKEFSFYEFVAIIVPSSFFMIGLLFFIYLATFHVIAFSSNDYIILLVIAYVLGHIIQMLSKYMMEWLVWKKLYHGMPTSWILKKQVKYLHNGEQSVIVEKLKKHNLTPSNLYQFIVAHGINTDRINLFNGNYALLRGLATSALCLSIIAYLITGSIIIVLITILITIVFIVRMVDFGIYYAKELFLTFLFMEI